MDFVQKSNFLLAVFFTEIISEKIVFRYFGKKTTIFIPNSAILRRAKNGNLEIWFLSKNRTFFYRCFSQKLWHKRSFFNILERQKSFFDKKLKFLQGSKNWHFLKGLVHGVCPKIKLFLNDVFHRNHIRKHRFWYCGKKRMILRPNSAVLTRAKKWKFWNLVFVQKSNFLLSLFFTEIMSQKIVF